MTAMKRFAVMMFVVAGCATTKPPAGGQDELQFEMAVASQIAFDITKLKKGEYALYSVRLLGDPTPKHVRLAVVDEDKEGIWIENRVPADPRPFVLKSKLSRKGELLEHWRGEAGSPAPAKLYPRADGKKLEAPARRDSSQAVPQFKEEPDQIKIGEKTWSVTKVTTTLTYPDGRKSVLTDWYSPEVPFSVVIKEKSYGGLIKRQLGRLTMEILSWGSTGAWAELEIPSSPR
jgi:hypothetical protein